MQSDSGKEYAKETATESRCSAPSNSAVEAGAFNRRMECDCFVNCDFVAIFNFVATDYLAMCGLEEVAIYS